MAHTRKRTPRPQQSRREAMHNGIRRAITAAEDAGGFRLRPEHKVIGAAETFRQWCERLASDGLKVDGHPFRLSDRPAMAWIYDQYPTTVEEAHQRMIVLMKCAQVGFTVMEQLACIYLGIKFGPATVGMFLPDMNLAGMKSSERFMPMVRSIPEIHAMMTQEAADGSGRKSGEGNVTRRRIDDVLFIFSWTSGRATTESIPMDILSFDEVQEMTLKQMEKTVERLSASTIKFIQMGSTANFPDDDIHHYYNQGTKHRFHTACPTCGQRKPLDDYFPACIKWDDDGVDPLTKRPGTYRYVCEDGHWIDDPQQGEWIADDPDAWVKSIHFHQMLSPTISPNEIIRKYVESTDKKNFYNRVLGKPFLDPSQIPVSLEHMAACVAAGRAAGVKWKQSARGAFMGIDQMGCFNVVVIKERLPDGRQAVIHLEMIYSDDPFARCSELMDQYGVQVCVGEVNPNYNDMARFARRHSGRVFICNSFGALPDDMIKWGDAPILDASERRTSDDERDRYTVRCDQFKCMQTSMARFTSKIPFCLWPDPQELTQDINEGGMKQHVAVAPIAFLHFTKTALVSVKDEESGTNEYKRVVRKIRPVDPHFSYANQLCDVAWARAHGTATIILADVDSPAEGRRASAEKMNMHGLPTEVVAMLEELPLGVCGRCTAFPEVDGIAPDRGLCAERNFMVKARDHACVLFAARS